MTYPEGTKERLLSKVRYLSTGCWQWTDSLVDEGYGHLNIHLNGRKVTKRAQRVSFELFVRELQPGEVTDHICENRGCVNPQHLRATDNRTNVLRGRGHTARNARKVRCKRGHPFTPENTRVYHGMRHCKKCCALRMRRRRASLKR